MMEHKGLVGMEFLRQLVGFPVQGLGGIKLPEGFRQASGLREERRQEGREISDPSRDLRTPIEIGDRSVSLAHVALHKREVVVDAREARLIARGPKCLDRLEEFPLGQRVIRIGKVEMDETPKVDQMALEFRI